MGRGRLTHCGRRALSAYTCTRINRGPIQVWLNKIRNANGLRCPVCQHHTQDGQHIVFHCPTLSIQHSELIGTREGTYWEHLDRPILIKHTREVKRQPDGTERFFEQVYNFLS